MHKSKQKGQESLISFVAGTIVLFLVFQGYRGCGSSKTDEPVAERKQINIIEKKVVANDPPPVEQFVEIQEEPELPRQVAPQKAAWGTEERLREDLKDKMGSHFSELSIGSGTITIMLSFKENLTAGLSKRAIKYDVKQALQLASYSDVDFSEVKIGGTYPFIDKFGNTNLKPAAVAVYSKATVNRINWNSILTEDIFDIADQAVLHPSLEE